MTWSEEATDTCSDIILHLSEKRDVGFPIVSWRDCLELFRVTDDIDRLLRREHAKCADFAIL